MDMKNYLQDRGFNEEIQQYTETFIQRQPRYCIKHIGSKAWKTKNKPLADRPILSHLDQKYIVGVLGKWYPGFTILDIDDTEKNRAEEIREKLKLDTDNSMLLSSESQDSYHILFRPSYNYKPPTIKLLSEILRPFANENNIEIYPQASKAIRLPFGYKQNNLDIEYLHLDTWQQKLYWFNKLNYFDLKEIPYQQTRLDFDIKEDIKISTLQEGHFLYKEGLALPSSRHDSQFKVLYYMWRQNIPLEVAIDLTFKWIRSKHNGYSKEILLNPSNVKKEIERQANRIYLNYDYKKIYPDDTHNLHNGYITKADIEKIFYITEASLPKAKFLFNIVKYCYPRRFRTFISIHSDKLRDWSKRGYQSQLEALQSQDIIKRYDSYQVDKFSKSIKINWQFKDSSQAILIDNRAPEDIKDTIAACYKPEEFRELLISAGSERDTAIKTTKRIFNTDKSTDI